MISPQETRLPAIRDPRPADEADWRVLWSGYCEFYETEVPETVTAATWERMLAVGSPLFGRIAECDGRVFVAPDLRGRGIARALIEDQLELCRRQGWSRLYWHTRDSNHEARRLYDHFATADDFVRYRMILE
jgi:GNAT superfamily N-acetyltransferase